MAASPTPLTPEELSSTLRNFPFGRAPALIAAIESERGEVTMRTADGAWWAGVVGSSMRFGPEKLVSDVINSIKEIQDAIRNEG